MTVGISATVVFTLWSLVAYRAAPEAQTALVSDSRVSVTGEQNGWVFSPANLDSTGSVGLLFLPGSLVDPVAYAPLARAAAEAGFPAYLIKLPWRGAFGGAKTAEFQSNVRAVMARSDVAMRWVLAGHSLGGVIASDIASQSPQRFAGLVLIATSHPRDVNLSLLSVPVTKIMGTNDGLATPSEVESNRKNLPAATNWVRIEGGNHSQFGWYGFQPGDSRATISPAVQHNLMIQAVVATLHRVADIESGNFR